MLSSSSSSSSSSKGGTTNNGNGSPAVLLLAAGALAGASMTVLMTTWMQRRRRFNNNHDDDQDHCDVEQTYYSKSKSMPNGSGKTSRSSSSSFSNDDNNKTEQQQQQVVTLPTALRQEQLSRHTLYFGVAGMERLQRARICVVGVGGVGSHTVVMLARAGVGCLRFIDFDQVSLSSLNRHACATLNDVGTAKVACLAQYCRQLCPDAQQLELQPYCEMYTEQSGARLLDPGHDFDPSGHVDTDSSGKQPRPLWDLVIDAIDDVPTKACLIADCLERGIRVLSCMGAGGKCDFTRLHVSDLRGAVKDPLATKLRQALKKRRIQLLAQQQQGNTTNSDDAAATVSSETNKTKDKNKTTNSDDAAATASSETNKTKDKKKTMPYDDDDSFYLDDMERLAVVYSSEKPVCKLADFTPQQKQDGVHQYGAVDGMRIRILPVLGTMPAIMGQGLAAVALTELAATGAGVATSDIQDDDGTKTTTTSTDEDLPRRMQPVTVERVSRNVRNRLLQRFMTREDQFSKRIIQEHGETANTSIAGGGTLFKITGVASDNDAQDENSTTTREIWIGPSQIDFDDVEYLMDIWRNRCAVTGARLGTVLELARWDVAKPSTCDNIILVSSHTLEKFQTNKSYSTEWIEPSIRRRIQERLASCRDSDA